MDKHKKYRSRNADSFRCPHCGKDAEGYYECADRREYKRLRNRKGVYKAKPDDVRLEPRLNGIPISRTPEFRAEFPDEK